MSERADLEASWTRITHLLATALAEVSEPAVVAAVAEDLAHNELGLAFEGLVDAGQSASRHYWSLLHSAMREMDLTSSDSVHGPAAREVEKHITLDS